MMQLASVKDLIPQDSIVKYFYAILLNIELINDRINFMSLSAKDYALSILAEFLMQFSVQDYSDFLSFIGEKYNYVSCIKQLIYWLNSLKEKKNKDNGYVSQLTELHKKLCNKILDNRINLLSDMYYHQYITDGLINENYDISEKTIKDYISSILANDNIYRVLGEIVSYLLSNTYMYYFSTERIKRFFENEIVIEKYISHCPPKNESELFLYNLYNEYKNGEVKFEGKKGIWKKEYFKFEL